MNMKRPFMHHRAEKTNIQDLCRGDKCLDHVLDLLNILGDSISPSYYIKPFKWTVGIFRGGLKSLSSNILDPVAQRSSYFL